MPSNPSLCQGGQRVSGWVAEERGKKFSEKGLPSGANCANIIVPFQRVGSIRVWRSLVSRLNGVQEAAGSSPVTRTKDRQVL